MFVHKYLSLLPEAAGSLTFTRCVSSKYIKPHPRSYRRRLYEAAVAPVMPEEVKPECKIAEVIERLHRERTELLDIEAAEVKEVKRWIKEGGFRTMAVCQFLSVNGRTMWLTTNQLRLQGIEVRSIENKIALNLFKNTPFEILEPLWNCHNVLLFGKDLEAVRTIMLETDKINFMIPLVLTYDERIMSVQEAVELSKLPELEMLRAQTVQILEQLPTQLTQALDHHSQELTTILGHVAGPEAPSD